MMGTRRSLLCYVTPCKSAKSSICTERSAIARICHLKGYSFTRSLEGRL